MKVLVTGTRAPASMDIIRSLIQQGHQVFSADSLQFPLGRFVSGLTKHFTLPKPNKHLDQFIESLKRIVIDQEIDLLIPTCEEIFYVSQGYDTLSQHCRLLCEPFSRLLPLHNKYVFNRLVVEYGLHAPDSWLLVTEADKASIPQDQALVLKPVYTRFGSHLIVKPSAETMQQLPLTVPYVAQAFVSGKEYCSYAIVDRGKVLIQACYHSKYTSGPAAGIYFEPVENQELTDFIRIFCERYQFSGQIAFDFIVSEGKAYVLECNPRVTSGFHFIAEHIHWESLVAGHTQSYQPATKPYMLGMAMKLQGFHYFRRNPAGFISDYRKAHDILKHPAYPWLGLKSLLTIANITGRMVKEKKTFHCASTDDIEFNGTR